MILARAVHRSYHEGKSKADATELVAEQCAAAAGTTLAAMSRVRRRLVRTQAAAVAAMAYGPRHCGPDHDWQICDGPAEPASAV
jgi:hypothetical protein